jgi:hypothetical protein
MLIYVSGFVVEQAIISRTPILKRPPVSVNPLDRLGDGNLKDFTVFNHIDIFGFRRATEGVPPHNIQTLAMMETTQLSYSVVKYFLSYNLKGWWLD